MKLPECGEEQTISAAEHHGFTIGQPRRAFAVDNSDARTDCFLVLNLVAVVAPFSCVAFVCGEDVGFAVCLADDDVFCDKLVRCKFLKTNRFYITVFNVNNRNRALWVNRAVCVAVSRFTLVCGKYCQVVRKGNHIGLNANAVKYGIYKRAVLTERKYRNSAVF